MELALEGNADRLAGVDEPRYVSVVIPTHNRPQLLATAVASVLSQDIPVEVIVVDDASQPPVAGLPIMAHPHITLIRNEKTQGPTRARNQGLEAATGAFVAFLDDDDEWLPGKLRRCIDILNTVAGVDVVTHRTVYDRDGMSELSDVTVLTNPLASFGVQQTPHLDGLMVDTALAKAVRFDESFDAAQDIDFVIELARRSPFAMVEDTLAVRGPQSDGSAIGLERRISARVLLLDKHGDVLYHDGPSRAFFHVRLGHLYRRSGRRMLALRSFATALRHQPGAAKAWRGLALSMLPAGVVHRLSVDRRRRAQR
ncbi:MAG: glycosyltransferase [Acidimicrobiia bacterium]|nr:glycosyltransferase [Acidimicrobiia bacterium]